jgi:hypothetical protein
MDNEPKLSTNFNKRLFSELKRKIFYKNLFNIILISFFKGITSFLDVILGYPKKKRSSQKNNQEE